jgi:hypothetical protein
VSGPSPHCCGVETSETRSYTSGLNYLTVAHVRVVIDAMRFRSCSKKFNTPPIISPHDRFDCEFGQICGYSPPHGSISGSCAFASSAHAIRRPTNSDVPVCRICRVPRRLCRPRERKVAAGCRRKQAPRIGFPRCEENVRYQPLFDDTALVHHNDPVADLARHTQIMRDEENCQPK